MTFLLLEMLLSKFRNCPVTKLSYLTNGEYKLKSTRRGLVAKPCKIANISSPQGMQWRMYLLFGFQFPHSKTKFYIQKQNLLLNQDDDFVRYKAR